MENLYTIKSVEISSRSVAKGEKNSITQKIDERPYALGDIKNLVQQTFDMIISQYGKDFFQKLVVKFYYAKEGTNLLNCIESGYDEQEKISIITIAKSYN
jgi:hypothetical protein